MEDSSGVAAFRCMSFLGAGMAFCTVGALWWDFAYRGLMTCGFFFLVRGDGRWALVWTCWSLGIGVEDREVVDM